MNDFEMAVKDVFKVDISNLMTKKFKISKIDLNILELVLTGKKMRHNYQPRSL